MKEIAKAINAFIPSMTEKIISCTNLLVHG